MKKLMCTATDFIDCVFSGVVKQGQFWGRTPEYLPRRVNRYDGNDLSGLDFRDVDFRCGVDLTRQTLPGGPEYAYVIDAEQAIQQARRIIVESWPDEEKCKDGLGFLGVLEGVVSEGQRQLIMRRSKKDDTANAVLDLIVSYAH
ncbi:hypothetical protein [Microbispora sp. NPDC049633]|uniref:hypothetical protein n=1 Tax=Microbispora sp. NPDC049633 TaxID=3154355 RepID=UPI00343A4820